MSRIKTLVTMVTPSPEVRAVLAELAPHAEVRFPDGAAVADYLDYLDDLEVLYGTLEEADFGKARKLRWVQTNSTGVDHMMYPAFQQSDIILTNIGAAITTIVAEHALAMLLALARNLHHQRDRMTQRRWEIVCGREVGTMTLGILGFGKIGRALAARAKAIVGAIHVLDVREVSVGGDVDRAFSFNRLHEFLEGCDAVVCSLPLTPQTHGLIAAREFETMRDDACLINISRGEIVVEQDLLEALRGGEIAGAGIDVLEQEPCPPDSPLWDEPNLLLTPHSAGFCERLEVRKIEQFVKNFRHYIRDGHIPGSIDKQRGW